MDCTNPSYLILIKAKFRRQFERMSRPGKMVQLGRSGEPHPLAVSQRTHFLVGKCCHFGAPGLGIG